MKIQTIEDDGRLVCHISGRFGFTAYELFGELLTRLSLSSAGEITLDLSALTFIDSVGLGMLRVVKDEADRMGRCFELIGASEDVARVLALADSIAAERDQIQQLVLLTAEEPCANLAKECEALGLSAAQLGKLEADDLALIHYGPATPEAVRAGLETPFRGFFEKGADGLSGIGPRCIEAVRRGGFALSVLTSTAYAIDLSQVFDLAVRQRFSLGKRASDGLISLCLAEAVSNAVIHGNLGIASAMRASREGFALFRKLMSERLADPTLARRRVEISLHRVGAASFNIAVSDRGNGYDIGKLLAMPVGLTDKHGRGLSLIRKSARSVVAEDGGRTIVMAF